MTHPIEQAADAAEHELADLRAKLAVAVGALEGVMTLLDAGALYEPQAYAARAALAQIKGDE